MGDSGVGGEVRVVGIPKFHSSDMSNGAVDNPLPSMDGHSCLVLS